MKLAPFTFTALAVLAASTLTITHLAGLNRRLQDETQARSMTAPRSPEPPPYIQNLTEKADKGEYLFPEDWAILSRWIESNGDLWNAYREAKYQTYAH